MLKTLILLSIFGAIVANAADSSEWCPAIRDADVKSYDIRFNKVALPTTAGSYFFFCQAFTIPDPDKDYHIIAWEAVTDNPNIVNHISVFTCDGDGEKRMKFMRNFTDPQVCDMDPHECPDMGFVWSHGQGKRCYVEEAGVAAGNRTFRTVILQVLYDSPSQMTNVIDSSGIRVYYVENRRPNDIALVGIGQIDFMIPPNAKAKATARVFNSSDNCSREALSPHDKYTIISAAFVMNDLATNAKITIRKPNGTAITIVDKAVITGKPTFVTWNKANAPTIEPGDDAEIECFYDSSLQKRSKYTFFGETVEDEMCFAYLEMYPRPNNRNFIEIYNIDDMNNCIWVANPEGPGKLHECNDVKGFANELLSIMNSTEGSYFMKYCYTEDYPATGCTRDCYLFLQEHQLLGNPCMKGSVFRYFGSFLYSPVYSDVFRIQSQTDICHGLKDVSQTIS